MAQETARIAAESQAMADRFSRHRNPPIRPVIMEMELESSGRSVPPTAEDVSFKMGDWPCFLGPAHNGTSQETGLISNWPDAGPPLLWEMEVGVGYSAPSVANGVMILHHRVGDESLIECLDPATGEWFWRAKHPSEYRDPYNMGDGPRSSPIIDGDRVYTLGELGEFFCLQRQTGEAIWKRSINEELIAEPNFFGVGSSPLLEGELLIVNVGSPNDAGIVAFDKRTGQTVWTATQDGPSYATPVCATMDDQRCGFVLTKSHLTALAPATGEVFWQYPFRSKNQTSCNAATPVVVDDLVFISNAYNVGGALLRVKQEGPTEVWRERKIMLNHWATSIHQDGYLYGVDGRPSNAPLHCIEMRTGETQWRHDGLGLASMISADGKLFIISEYGKLAVAPIDPNKFQIAAESDVLERPCYTVPVLARGLLYVRDQNRLLCFDVRDHGA
jgi:outer membrane protein assembly factor BamB